MATMSAFVPSHVQATYLLDASLPSRLDSELRTAQRIVAVDRNYTIPRSGLAVIVDAIDSRRTGDLPRAWLLTCDAWSHAFLNAVSLYYPEIYENVLHTSMSENINRGVQATVLNYRIKRSCHEVRPCLRASSAPTE